MIINLDIRFKETNSPNLACHRDFFAIRIEPTTNEEMAKLELILKNGTPTDFIKNIFLNRIEYTVIFGGKETVE